MFISNERIRFLRINIRSQKMKCSLLIFSDIKSSSHRWGTLSHEFQCARFHPNEMEKKTTSILTGAISKHRTRISQFRLNIPSYTLYSRFSFGRMRTNHRSYLHSWKITDEKLTMQWEILICQRARKKMKKNSRPYVLNPEVNMITFFARKVGLINDED